MESDQLEEALDLLEPLTNDFPRDAELQMMVAICYLGVDDPDSALFYFESAYEIDKESALLLPLGLTYYQLEMYGSALYAFHESIRHGLLLPDDVQEALAGLRQSMGTMAEEIGLPLEKVLPGLREMEHAIRMLAYDEYGQANEASRKAIKILGDWPDSHNYLALGLYFDGQVPAAIAECRQVLVRRPDNTTAVSNLIRFLAWSGDRAAAEVEWQQIRLRTPVDPLQDGIPLAEAAAVVDDDEGVRRLLLPLADWSVENVGGQLQYLLLHMFLAIADANLGDREAAERRLRKLGELSDPQDEDSRLKLLVDSLRQGKPGLGFTSRFSYYTSSDVAPVLVSSELAALAEAVEDGSPGAVKALKQFVARYPQLVVMAEKMIWEEDAVNSGLLALRYVGTPAAHDALRRFASSQAGSEEQRELALFYLKVSGGM
jgi:tetratricopeptide (TPR) repeat protein